MLFGHIQNVTNGRASSVQMHMCVAHVTYDYQTVGAVMFYLSINIKKYKAINRLSGNPALLIVILN